MELLARLSNQGEDAIPIGAGLATIRTVSRWHFRGLGDAVDSLSLRMALEQVDAAHPLAAPLHAIVATVAPLLEVEAARPDALLTSVRASLARHLHAYGIALEQLWLHGAARDAYTLMRALADSVAAYGDTQGKALARSSDFAWARAALAEGSLEEAADAYAVLAHDAHESGSPTAIAEATLGLAAVAEARQDWRAAGEALAAIYTLAARSDEERAVLQPCLAAARRAEARVAAAREDWPAAARALNAVVLATDDEDAQDLLLSEFGSVMLRMRALRPARAIFECLSACADRPEVRWRSDLALLAIHAACGAALPFERCRRRLMSRSLPAAARAEVLFATAHGYRTLGDRRRASHGYLLLQRFAHDNGLATLARAASGALEEMSRSLVSRAVPSQALEAARSVPGFPDATGRLQVVRAADAAEIAEPLDEWTVMAREAAARRMRAQASTLTSR